MDEVLGDIREKLRRGVYQNEEHVRLSLVCRLLYKLGWNIWDPTEVNTEFPAVPAEDKTRVDVALFADSYSPSVYIEVKAVGKIHLNLSEVERQVRDYNRNNTALFSVITDGTVWRLYYSQTGGEFHQKCFKECDLLEDDLEDLRQTFSVFLGKESILSGRAEDEARKYLQLSKKQKAFRDCLLQAGRLVQAPPYPSLPEAVVKLMTQKGFHLSEKEAVDLIETMPPPEKPPEGEHKEKTETEHGIKINPDSPGDLRFTRVEGTICGKHGRKWKELVDIGIGLAIAKGESARSLNAHLPTNIREGIYTGEGFSPIENLGVSVQGMDANSAARTLVLLAKILNCPLELTISWHGKSPNAGKQSLLRWEP